jgi:hypothetical protein
VAESNSFGGSTPEIQRGAGLVASSIQSSWLEKSWFVNPGL